MISVKFLVLISLYGLSQCQTCDYTSYKECLRQSFESERQQTPTDPQQKIQLEQQVRDCFKNSGCKDPNFNDNTNDHAGPPPASNGLDGRRECFKKIHENAQNVVETCVQKTISNFHFNDDNERRDGEDHGHHNFHEGMGNIGQRMNQFCPDQGSKDKVSNCMRQLWEKPDNPSNTNDHDQGRKEAEERFKRMCDKKTQCFNGMTPQCQAEFNNRKATICNCAQTELQPKKNDYDRQLDSCLSSTGQQSQSQSPFGGRRKKSSIEMTMKRMCPDKDICDKGFPSEQHSGPNRPSFPGRG